MKEEILQNIVAIQDRINKACEKCGRNKDGIRLLLATKTVPAERIKMALLTGQTLIAENKVQELKEKYEELKEIPHTNHFIGHLQAVKDLLKYDVSCLQSLDRLDLAEKLHQRLQFENKTMDVLIQTLKIKGLMTIGLFSAETEKVRPCFRLLKDIQQKVIALKISNIEMKGLSMGMSDDLETAIEEGATIIRIGTAIFGQRNTPDSYYWNENVN